MHTVLEGIKGTDKNATFRAPVKKDFSEEDIPEKIGKWYEGETRENLLSHLK